MYFQKKTTFALLCLITLLLAACNPFGGGNTTQSIKLVKAPANKQVYTVPQVGISDVTTLDPALVLAWDTPSLSAIQMLYTGLVGLNDNLQVQPQLAKSWDLASDGVTWTFHLKPGLKFSDGTLLTSADVVYSIDRALQPATKSTIAPNYLGILKDADQLLAGRINTLIGDSLQTPDANTVVLVAKKPAAYFLSILTYPCSYVVEKKLIDTYGADFARHLTEGGSSGPFKIGQYIRGQEIDFVPNTNYYDPEPQLQKVVFPFYAAPEKAYQAYQAGQVDTTDIPVSTFASDKKRKDFHQVPQLWINYYTMNYLVKPFDSIHMRQAFALAIDKTAIANDVWKGTVLPTNHIVPQGMTGYNPDLKGPDDTQSLKGNPTQAKALLQKGLQDEGWTSISQIPPIKLTYATGPSMTTFDQEATAMAKMWQDVLGVTVTPDPVDFNTLLDKVTAATNNNLGLQFWGFAWVAEYSDPQDWLTTQFDRAVPNNSMNYGQNLSVDAAQQQAVQQQLEAADTNMQQDARITTYQQAEQQLVKDVAWMPMEQVTTTFLRTPSIVGMVDNAQSVVPPDDWANIYKAIPES